NEHPGRVHGKTITRPSKPSSPTCSTRKTIDSGRSISTWLPANIPKPRVLTPSEWLYLRLQYHNRCSDLSCAGAVRNHPCGGTGIAALDQSNGLDRGAFKRGAIGA